MHHKLKNLSKDSVMRIVVSLFFIFVVTLIATSFNDSPRSIAAPSSPKLYIAVSDEILGNSKVSVLDTGNDTIMANIPVGNDPFDVKLKPDNTRVYVINQKSNDISVIDTSTNAVTATIPLAGTSYPDNYPVSMSLNSLGTRIYTANQGAGGDSVVVVDTGTNSVIDTIPVGSFPNALAAKPGSNELYVLMSGGDLKIIDTNTNTVTSVVSLATDYQSMTFSSNGSRLYVTNSDGVMLVIDAATNTEITKVLISPISSNSNFNQDETSLYTIGPSCSVSVLNTTNNQWSESIPLLAQGGCGGVVSNPTDRRLYVSNTGTFTLSVLNRTSGDTIAVLPMGGSPKGMVIKP